MNTTDFFALVRRLVTGAATVLMLVVSSGRGDDPPTETWQQLLPPDVRASILWSADHEEGTLFDWEYWGNPHNNGGGIFNTGSQQDALAETDQVRPLTGKFCAKTTIHNAFQSRFGARAVRLMRWTDKPWDQGGKFLPDSAYYGVWMRMDNNYTVRNHVTGSGGWWNVFQFKSNDSNGKSQPVWTLNVGNDRQSGRMYFYLYSNLNKPSTVSQKTPVSIPVGRWFHVEALYQQSSKGAGSILIWQDGQLILGANKVKTVLGENAIWGVGNYTDHITGGTRPGSATIYFDDATISIEPTHNYVNRILKNFNNR